MWFSGFFGKVKVSMCFPFYCICYLLNTSIWYRSINFIPTITLNLFTNFKVTPASAHTSEVEWLYGVVFFPVLSVVDVVDVPGGSQYDPVPSQGDATQLLLYLTRAPLPDVEHRVHWDLRQGRKQVPCTPPFKSLGSLRNVLVCFKENHFFCPLK